MEKETKEFLIEVKEYIVDLIKDGFIYTLKTILLIFVATIIGMILYALYLDRNAIIKTFLSLLLTAISFCVLFAVVALIKRFFDFISDKIEESAEISDKPNISNEKGEK